jgi:hypothetical protein
MHQMLECLADNGFIPHGEDIEGEIVENLIEESVKGSELAEYLSKFSHKERITISDIVKDIEGSEGNLTHSETLFLVMNEFLK